MGGSSFKWVRPEAYPLFGAIGVVVGLCVTQLVRNVWTNPEVRLTKENRTAGVLENFDEGYRYRENALRRFVRDKPPQIMPSVNKFFSKDN